MRRPRFTVYAARDGYRWRLLAANNRLIAESGEAYTRERDAWRAVKLVRFSVVRSRGPESSVFVSASKLNQDLGVLDCGLARVLH